MKGLFIAALLALPTGVAARCAPDAQVTAALEQKHGEHERFVGLSGEVLVRVFVNTETGSWTVMHTNAAGVSCLLAVGAMGQLKAIPDTDS